MKPTFETHGAAAVLATYESLRPELARHDREKEPGLQDPVTLAKRYILAELEEGHEPTAAEVAEAVGMESRPLGRMMKAAGLEARNVRREGVKGRRYTLEMLDILKQ